MKQSRPDLLSLVRAERDAVIMGETPPKREPHRDRPPGGDTLKCGACGTRLLLTREKYSEGTKRLCVYWCLNALCASFCDDVQVIVG